MTRIWIARAAIFAAIFLLVPTAAIADNIVFPGFPDFLPPSLTNTGWGGGVPPVYAGWTATVGEVIFGSAMVPFAFCSGSVVCPGGPGFFPFATTTYLYFETSGWGGLGSGTVGNEYQFGPGGLVLVYDVANNIWFTGTFMQAQFANDSATPNQINFSGNFVVGTINPAILAGLGFPTGTTSVTGYITAIFQGQLANGSGPWDQGSLSVTPVPEPGTLALFGMGLIGVAGLIRRRIRA